MVIYHSLQHYIQVIITIKQGYSYWRTVVTCQSKGGRGFTLVLPGLHLTL